MTYAKRTISAVIWSLSQSFVVKILSLILFFLLTWFLNPEDFGVAAAVILVLAFSQILVDAGIPFAIVQKRRLTETDFSFPFLISMITAALIGVVYVLFSKEIAGLLSIEGYSSYIAAIFFVPVVLGMKSYFEAFCQREMKFKEISLSTIVATAVSGTAALLLAFWEFDSSLLIIQFILLNLFIAILLFPSLKWDWFRTLSLINSKEIYKYSSMNFLSNLIDFFAARVVDFIVLSKFGVYGLGLYTVASKLYLTLVELFATSIVKVFFSSFSHIQEDRTKLKDGYLRLLFFSSGISMPLFLSLVFLAAPATALIFNADWKGVDSLIAILSILGAILVVQYFNGALINATGRSDLILLLNSLKFISALSILSFITIVSINDLVYWYVLSQVLITPVSFYYAAKLTGSNFVELFQVLLPSIVSSVVSLLTILYILDRFSLDYESLAVGISLLFVFVFLYLFFLLVLGHKRIKGEYFYIKGIINSKGCDG